MWIYDENWIAENETLIKATYAEAGAPYDTSRASVWNARCVSQAASGALTRQKARWSTLNALRSQLGVAQMPAPLWCGEEVGTLRVDGLRILNDGTPYGTVPWMLMGYRMFDALGLHLYGIRPFGQSLDYPAQLGFNTAVISTMMYMNNGHPVTLSPLLNPDLYDHLQDCATLATARGIRLFVYACADANALGLDSQALIAHWMKICEVLQGGYHVLSVVNEGPNNGIPNSRRFPTPANCPIWSRGSMGEFAVTHQAPIGELEVNRRGVGEDPFKMSADMASVEYHNEEPSGPRHMKPMIFIENTFAGPVQQLGRRTNQPRLITAQAGAAFVTAGYGCGGYAFGSENSRLGQPLTGAEHDCAEAAIQTMRRAW